LNFAFYVINSYFDHKINSEDSSLLRIVWTLHSIDDQLSKYH
jgi:hypothetical protein